MKTKISILLLVFFSDAFASMAESNVATDFSFEKCQGSLMPYPEGIAKSVIPDSLLPVMINHVGRHGARYPSSATNCHVLRSALAKADSLGTITDVGRKLLSVTEREIELSNGRWGALDSLGEAEQRGIASRMYANFTHVFDNANVAAISSYVPRCMMSMYAFTHQLDCLDKNINFITTTGSVNNEMLRPFQIDEDYLQFRKGAEVKDAYGHFFESRCPTSAIKRALGPNYPFDDDAQARDLAMAEYYVIAGLSAMSVSCDASQFFSKAEYNELWSCFNMRQYLQRTASSISAIPAEIAKPLLNDLIYTTDAFIEGKSDASVLLRFGHAETLMPLLSLMRLPGCYYVTADFDTVAVNWQDFYVVPMAANLQMILFRSNAGHYYMRFDLNEQPIPIIPNSDKIYIPWTQAKQYLLRCLNL